MKLFLDSSALLTAAAQRTGASRAVLDAARNAGWELQASNYVLREVATNIQRLPAAAAAEWPLLAQRLVIVRDPHQLRVRGGLFTEQG